MPRAPQTPSYGGATAGFAYEAEVARAGPEYSPQTPSAPCEKKIPRFCGEGLLKILDFGYFVFILIWWQTDKKQAEPET